jgi:hypothetical protein
VSDSADDHESNAGQQYNERNETHDQQGHEQAARPRRAPRMIEVLFK